MSDAVFFIAGKSRALDFASDILTDCGFRVLTKPDSRVTHLLLPVPSFDADGSLKGSVCLASVLESLPDNITVIGGNLEHPALSGYQKIDLMLDDDYVAKNADITAHCAIRLAMQSLPVTLQDCKILVIGWGRIGKCLAKHLRQLGARVFVSARKSSDRAMLRALGYDACDVVQDCSLVCDYRIVFNTVPVMVLPEPDCNQKCLKIDLASKPGIGGDDVVMARGLPGKDAPESSGNLIAERIVHILEERKA